MENGLIVVKKWIAEMGGEAIVMAGTAKGVGPCWWSHESTHRTELMRRDTYKCLLYW